VALVRKSCFHADLGRREFGAEHLLAGSPYTKTANVIANTVSHVLAEHSRQIHRMQASLATQVPQRQPLATFGSEFVKNSPKPRRRLGNSVLGHSRYLPQHFGKQALDEQITDDGRSLKLAEHFHPKPE
jgi:hypothetical protein